jgi:maleate cis-trans isomerase
MRQSPLKIGFLGSSAPSSPHHESFRAFIPKDIEFTFVQEAGEKASLYDARGKVDALIDQASKLIAEHKWQGVIISGGPKEALNPGMWEQVSAALPIPVSLALRSSVAALKTFDTRRILLMTPVDDRLKQMYREYIAGFGIETFFPLQTLRAHTDALKLTSDGVKASTRTSLAQYPDVDAIYFQGALLDPLPVLEEMEAEFQLPIVASNPAMLWLLLSKLGRSDHISGYGKLLASWPQLPDGPF